MAATSEKSADTRRVRRRTIGRPAGRARAEGRRWVRGVGGVLRDCLAGAAGRAPYHRTASVTTPRVRHAHTPRSSRVRRGSSPRVEDRASSAASISSRPARAGRSRRAAPRPADVLPAKNRPRLAAPRRRGVRGKPSLNSAGVWRRPAAILPSMYASPSIRTTYSGTSRSPYRRANCAPSRTSPSYEPRKVPSAIP